MQHSNSTQIQSGPRVKSENAIFNARGPDRRNALPQRRIRREKKFPPPRPPRRIEDEDEIEDEHESEPRTPNTEHQSASSSTYP